MQSVRHYFEKIDFASGRVAQALVFLIPVLVLGPLTVVAAPLTYSSDTTVSILSPSVNFTIKSGSVADSFVVNSGNVVIGMSSTTGGTFTLTSPQAISNSISGSGGTLSSSCSSGVSTFTITQSSNSSTYTLTPTGSACISGNTVGGSVGVGGYVASPTPAQATTTPAVATTTFTTATSSNVNITLSPQDQLQALLTKLQTLQAQAQQQGITVGTSTVVYTSSFHFTRNLGLWDSGDDVHALQVFLIQKNIGYAARKLAAHGASRVFGILTYNALKRFQASVGLSAAGFFGSKTRAYINSLNHY